MSHYRIAMTMAWILAALQSAIWIFLYIDRSWEALSYLSHNLFLTFAVIIGLWLYSRFVRYGGAILFLLWGCVMMWALYLNRGSEIPTVLVLSFVIMGILYLAIGGLLVASKKFGDEFTAGRMAQSQSQARLRTIFLSVLVVVVVPGRILDRVGGGTAGSAGGATDQMFRKSFQMPWI